MINSIFSVITIVLGVVAVLGPIGAAVALIVAPAVALPFIKTLVSGFLRCRFCVLLVAVVIACVGSYWVGRLGEYRRGVDDTVALVARGDATLVGRAREARSKLKDCQAQGKAWSQSTGECR